MRKVAIFFLFIFSLNGMASPPRTAFVQLFEWTWDDIATECKKNLGPNGFAAVQVSPPQEHLSISYSPWWERYQPISYQIKSRSGDENQFRKMIKTCHDVGVDVYVDVVFNHMAGMQNGLGNNGTIFTHYSYPNLYGYDDFHHCGRNGNDDIANYFDLYELQNCELVNLADLRTESLNVQSKIINYLNHLVDLGADGFRVDAAKHIPAKDLKAIYRKIKKNVYILQELITSGNDPFRLSDYTAIGDVSAYAYPYLVGNAFKNKQFNTIPKIFQYMPDSDDSIVMLENHDLERAQDRGMLLTANDNDAAFDLAQVFMLTYPFGYPQLYSSYRFDNFDDGPPLDSQKLTQPILNEDLTCRTPFMCQHKRSYVNRLVKFRNIADDHFYVTNWWSNGVDILAFSRGDKGFVLINNSDNFINQRFQTGLRAGQYCDLYLNDCSKKVLVDENGYGNIYLNKKSALVIQ